MTPDERKQRRIIRKLESFARSVVADKIFDGGVEGFLDIQEQVFKLQMEIQQAISDVKRRRKKDQETLTTLEHLRHLRWMARRLGDAIAWNCLLYDRQVIYSLNKNDPVPTASSWSDGHRGAFQFARSMAGPEWGLPIVHDITNVLRVGDVTFMLPAEHQADTAYRTVELKTTRVSESMDENGETIITLNVTAVSNEPFPIMPDPTATEPQAPPDLAPMRRPDRRIERQMARMDIATASKNAKLNELTKIGDRHVFSFQLPEEQQPHWKELRRAIRLARRDGYSYLELGGFVGYSLIYNDRGVTTEDIQGTPMADNVKGLLREEIGNRNSVTVSFIPDREGDRYGSLVIPVYLWDVPQRAVRDILRRRLVICATYNSGRMERLLGEEGLVITPDDGPGKDPRDFEVVAPISWENASGEYHARPWEEMYVAVHEFRGPRAVVQRVTIASKLPDFATPDDILGTSPGALS